LTGNDRLAVGKAARRSVVLPYRRDMPARKRPTAEDTVTARRVLLDGLARDADILELVSELAPLHPRNVARWQADDFWQYALFAAVAYIRAAASRAASRSATHART
jgi:hypothetical protein